MATMFGLFACAIATVGRQKRAQQQRQKQLFCLIGFSHDGTEEFGTNKGKPGGRLN